MESSKAKSIRGWLRRWGWRYAIVTFLLVLALVGWWHWDWIQQLPTLISWDFAEHDGERSRNLVLIFAALLAPVGLFMAYWRNRTADRHAEAAHKQTETAERGLQSDRYQRGAEMLGGDVLAVRMGGILALERLALEPPAEYHIQIMDLLCAFILHPYEDANHPGAKPTTIGDIPQCPPDAELAVQVIGRRSEGQRKIETENKWRADLRGANLINANLRGANLRGANLTNANLTNADLTNADLTNADLTKVILSEANLIGANLIGANLTNANLTKVILSEANLIGANLANADLTNADLTKVILSEANLIGANLTKVILSEANLTEAILTNANLANANLTKATLIGTILAYARLANASLTNANLTNANLTNADLTRAVLFGVRGLTQEQFNTAQASKDALPNLTTNAFCAKTGKPLAWGGTTIEG